MRLYGITAAEIELTIAAPDRRDHESGYVIAYRRFYRKFGDQPLKVIYAIEGEPVIVTVYPLRKTHWR